MGCGNSAFAIFGIGLSIVNSSKCIQFGNAVRKPVFSVLLLIFDSSSQINASWLDNASNNMVWIFSFSSSNLLGFTLTFLLNASGRV